MYFGCGGVDVDTENFLPLKPMGPGQQKKHRGGFSAGHLLREDIMRAVLGENNLLLEASPVPNVTIKPCQRSYGSRAVFQNVRP